MYKATTAVGTYPVAFVGLGDAAADGSALTKVSATEIDLLDTDGTKTVWTYANSAWAVSKVVESGSSATTTYTRDASGRVTRILAPVPAGVTCTSPDGTPGYRSLTLDYSPVVVGASTYQRLATVTFHAYDPQTSAMAAVAVASYDYDTAGRLAHAWDPRITPALKTAYTYDAAGRLATLTPPGLAAWTLTYDPGGRLVTASHPDPSGPAATTTIVYDVPFTGTGAPVDLSGGTSTTWGRPTTCRPPAPQSFRPATSPPAPPRPPSAPTTGPTGVCPISTSTAGK